MLLLYSAKKKRVRRELPRSKAREKLDNCREQRRRCLPPATPVCLLRAAAAGFPRAFGQANRHAKQQPPKTRMNSKIFLKWLEQFSECIREQGRKALQLLDIFLAHKTDATLSNTEIFMLPPNTTSHIQPKDGGVIQAPKSNISELKNEHAVERIKSVARPSGQSKRIHTLTRISDAV